MTPTHARVQTVNAAALQCPKTFYGTLIHGSVEECEGAESPAHRPSTSRQQSAHRVQPAASPSAAHSPAVLHSKPTQNCVPLDRKTVTCESKGVWVHGDTRVPATTQRRWKLKKPPTPSRVEQIACARALKDQLWSIEDRASHMRRYIDACQRACARRDLPAAWRSCGSNAGERPFSEK